MAVAATERPWLGDSYYEAQAAFHRARRAGLSILRSLVVGNIASFKDCWTFRSNIASFLGISVRTVQRGITDAKAQGLIGVGRVAGEKAKTEIPPGKGKDGKPFRPFACGWCHRWTIGWGKAGEAVKEAVEAARARWLVKHAIHLPERAHATLNVNAPGKSAPRTKLSPSGRELRTMTREEIQRELDEALARLPVKPPD